MQQIVGVKEMSKKAEVVFEKLAGPINYIKTILNDTKNLKFNINAVDILKDEALSTYLRGTNKIKNIPLSGVKKIDKPILKSVQKETEKELSHLSNLEKEYKNKVWNGLKLPIGGAVAVNVGGLMYVDKRINNINKQ